MSKVEAQKCGKCEKTVYPLEMIVACDKPWHKQCFRCTHCDNVISLKGFATIDGSPYCKPHYLELFKSKGTYKVFSGDQGSTSYNASAGFKGMEHINSPKSGSGSASGSSIKSDSASSSPKTPSAPKATSSPASSGIKKESGSEIKEAPKSGSSGSKIQEEIKSGSKLAHTETVDKSAPVIDKDAVIKKVDRTGFLSEVEGKHDLKKTEVVDKSTPAIPSAVKPVDHTSLLKEVEESGSTLKHVEEIHDKSAPVIEKVHVKKIDRKEMLKAVENPPQLRDVEDYARDRSAPVIDPEVKVKSNARPSMLEQIAAGPEKPLTKPDAQTDRSAPKIPGSPSSQSKCATCGKTVYDLEMLRACDKVYHKACFRCKKCENVISLKGFAMIDGDPYCKPHYLEIFKSKGNYSTFAGGNDSASSSYNASKGFKGY